jgi:hypothetical protein
MEKMARLRPLIPCLFVLSSCGDAAPPEADCVAASCRQVQSEGSLSITYAGASATAVTAGEPFELRYQITGEVTPADAIAAEVHVGSTWQATLFDGTGAAPFALHLGTGTGELVVRLVPPAQAPASATITVLVYARSNPSHVRHLSITQALSVGEPLPVARGVAVTLLSTNLTAVGGVLQYPPTVSGGMATVNLALSNLTEESMLLDMSYEPQPAPAGWTVIAPSGASLQSRSVAPGAAVTIAFGLLRPSAAGTTISLGLRTTLHGTDEVIGEGLVAVAAVAE